MKEQVFDRSIQAFPRPAEPRFEDEQTLLSARPVVPLEKLDAKLKRRRRWFLGGAFAIAMMLGAASALLASYLKLRSVPSTASEISEIEHSSAPLAVAAPVASDPPVVEEIEEPETLETPVTPAKASAAKRRTPANRNSELIQPLQQPRLSEEEELNRIREAVLIDQWEERRARRATRRERRRIERNNHRDLSNLDEIFEGPKRP